MKPTAGLPDGWWGAKGVVHAIHNLRITCMIEGVGETDLFPNEVEVIDLAIEQTFQTGDFVRVIPTMNRNAEGKNFIGVVGRIESWDTHYKDKLPCVQFISPDPNIHNMKWYLWHYELEKVDPNAGLPAGVSRCKVCYDSTTSSSEGVCCDCKVKKKPFNEWW